LLAVLFPWANALKKVYYLRHTFASRLTSAGVSPLTIAQMLGHSSTQIVPRYAQVLDQNRLDAMKKLEALRISSSAAGEPTNGARSESDGPTGFGEILAATKPS